MKQNNNAKPRIKWQGWHWMCIDDELYSAAVAYGSSVEEAYKYWKLIKENRGKAVAHTF